MKFLVTTFDRYMVQHLHKMEIFVARIAIFIVYFWFGILKLFNVSPAEPLVRSLFNETLAFMPFTPFYIAFACFEMLIGFMFLLKGYERFAILLITIHLFTTMLPLLFLPEIAWQGFLVPTLEGQYIIKNVLIASSAIVVGSKLVPLRAK